MTKNIAMLNLRYLPAIEVQIGTTNGGGGNAQDDIVRLLDNGIGNIFYLNMMRTVVRQKMIVNTQ